MIQIWKNIKIIKRLIMYKNINGHKRISVEEISGYTNDSYKEKYQRF